MGAPELRSIHPRDQPGERVHALEGAVATDEPKAGEELFRIPTLPTRSVNDIRMGRVVIRPLVEFILRSPDAQGSLEHEGDFPHPEAQHQRRMVAENRVHRRNGPPEASEARQPDPRAREHDDRCIGGRAGIAALSSSRPGRYP
jgi:hypothetical protein